MQIVARTAARRSFELDEALRRGEAFTKTGADVSFIESPEAAEELETTARIFDTPLLVNIIDGMRTPQLTAAEMQKFGFPIAIFPAWRFLALAKALRDVYGQIEAQRGTTHVQKTLYPFSKMCESMGFAAASAMRP